MKKILYGVCGIGGGHTHRQLPLIEHFSRSCRMVIFAYGYSFKFYKDYFQSNRNISIVPVAVPFYVGDKGGVDIEATKKLPQNQGIDFDSINSQAEKRASEIFGVPDLVITDYEPISAQFAHERGAPLITIDQQSKYLCADLPDHAGGVSVAEELARLKMFFPEADTRIACSFFNVPQKQDCDHKVEIVPPVIKKEVLELDRNQSEANNILVYISAARNFIQPPLEILRICSEFGDVKFNVFLESSELLEPDGSFGPNIKLYHHGDTNFYKVLGGCNGIVSTAGHSLLSEAMYLGIPVYAIPVGPYEQQMNAKTIDDNNFGIAHPKIDIKKMAVFINNLKDFRNSIQNDEKILLKTPGQDKIIQLLENKYFYE